MFNSPLQKATPPDWKKGKQVDQNKALKLKRMREELVAAKYGNARSVSRWSECKIVETYKRLEQLREKDPTVPKKPVYPTVVVPQQTLILKKQSSVSGLSIAALNQAKRQKQMSEADEQMYDYYRKEGLKKQLLYHTDTNCVKHLQIL
ncbi:hypothetical protein Hanom_Chr08g00729561 [Helianthus anomalus]